MAHLVPQTEASIITAEIRAAVDAVLDRHGLKAGRMSTRYGDRYEFKIEASPVTEGPNGVNLTSPEATAYLASAKFHGFDPDALGKEFLLHGKFYVFEGELRRNHKYRWLFREVSTGKNFKFADGPTAPATLALKEKS